VHHGQRGYAREQHLIEKAVFDKQLPTPLTPVHASAHKSNRSTTRSPTSIFSSDPEAEHSFRDEPAQVLEPAEEFGSIARDLPILHLEERELVSLGLFKFAAEDYIHEL
jgi:hypothetical protein